MFSKSVRRVAGLVFVIVQSAFSQAPAGAATNPSVPIATQADSNRFDVLEFEVEGNTVLASRAVEAALLPLMGEGRTLADVEAARNALENAYQQRGYLTVLVDIPEQRVADGVVRLRVTEGRIESVRVTGARYFSQGYIREVATALQVGQAPDLNALQAQLAELNRTADRQVQPVLRPGLQPGWVEVELKVQDQLPMSGNLTLNNHHTPNTEPLRLVASARYDNLFQRGYGLSLTAITAPQAPKQSQVLVTSLASPLADQASLVSTLVLSNSTVQPIGATVLGQGFTFGMRWMRPFSQARASHTVSAGFEYRDLDQQVVGGDSSVATPLRYMPFQLGYQGQWWPAEAGQAGETRFSSVMTFGLRGLLEQRIPCPGTTVDGLQDQFACNRDGADGGFATWRADLGHSLPAAGGTLALRALWQLAMQPLVSGEQMSLGGAETVRGYLESEVSGDVALLLSAEWRSANLARRLVAAEAALNELAVSVFADVAQARLHDPLPDQAARQALAGAGLGLRMRAFNRAQAELDLAWPFKNTRNTVAHSARLHARLGLQF